jgi:hypothetical protein
MIKTIIVFIVVFLQQNAQPVEAACTTTTITTIITTTTLALEDQFNFFVQSFSVNYENEIVAAKKFAVFKANLDVIAQHSADVEAGISSYEIAVNRFADLVSIS